MVLLPLPIVPLEELPRPPELEPDVLGLLVLGLELLPELEVPTPELEVPVPELALPPARARASQSCLAMPVSDAHWLRSLLLEPLVLDPRLPEVLPDVLPAVPGDVVLLLELGEELLPLLLLVLGEVVLVLGEVLLELEGLELLGLVAEDPPMEPLELEVCATETPAAPRNAAATAAQRSLLVIVSLLEMERDYPGAGSRVHT